MSDFDREACEKLQLSGSILRETREEIRGYVREGMKIIDVCERAEDLIRNKGAKPAFPCNVSINEIAAHYTSPPSDDKTIPENSLVKVDIGAHVDGYLTDTAVSICFNSEYQDLVDAADRALEVAIENLRPDITTSRLGSIIESTIKSRGFKPVSNLTGHQVGRYVVHTGVSLPNVSHILSSKIKLGGIYAIEPFVTLSSASGRVENSNQATIFRFVKSKSTQNQYARRLLKYIDDNFRTLPFSERWLQNVIPQKHYEEAFSELLKSRALMRYPVFVEASGNTVAQAEHTVLVVRDGCEVLT